MMRFYLKRLKEFEETKKIIENLKEQNLEGALYAVSSSFLTPLGKRMVNLSIEATSFRVYQLSRSKRKHRVLRPGDYYEFVPKRYFKMQIDDEETLKRLNKRYDSYLSRARKKPPYKSKKDRYPYSKRVNRPPINPAFTNIQSGLLNSKFKSEVRVTPKTVSLRISNETLHFYFIASSVDSKASKMIPRPLMDYLHIRFRRVYQPVIPRFYTAFQKTIYKWEPT